jgi:ATP-dependent DNA helicase RecG
MSRIVPLSAPMAVDPLAASIKVKQALPDLAWALSRYHFPSNWAERDKARERLAFDEFFFLELALAMNRQERDQLPKDISYVIRKTLLTPFKNRLGFEFTRAQTRVINEIFRDMQRASPMNRLLQGDVGSGKTVVALSAALLAIENGCQAAFLAPTEILANQHALSIERLFKGLPVSTALLTGSTPKSERKSILARIKEGKINLVIGTHAILGDEVQFEKLGLVVIDEQHRFGVRQRARLVTKSQQPDVLIMTATPIPRTLALTLYGDLDVSVIDASPEGRVPIKTSCASETEAFSRIEAELQKGRQAYLVFPLVGESEELAKRSGKAVLAATKEFDRIKSRFPGYSVALLHGQMDSDEKKKAMEQFRSGAVSVLVATPVIEVGIDVPNATAIAIVNPERFGMAQLHQLRGRVGRGAFSSECILIHDVADEEPGGRLSLFCSVQDGFKLAEEDLKLRGPGEFVGEAQHGLPFFRVGDLINDGLLISQAREAAKSLVEGEIALTYKELALINRTLQKRFGTKLHLSRVG